MTFSPQKVKNMVTFLPIAAAPLAMTNEARARSRSSLNTMSVLWSAVAGAGRVEGHEGSGSSVSFTLRTHAVTMPP